MGIHSPAGSVCIAHHFRVEQVTLGPRGRNILLEKDYGPQLIVNDGVTIARNIELPNRAHNAGAKLVQEVASTSDEWAGDGTSSTTILTAEIAKKVCLA